MEYQLDAGAGAGHRLGHALLQLGAGSDGLRPDLPGRACGRHCRRVPNISDAPIKSQGAASPHIWCEFGVESEDQHRSGEPAEHMHDQALVGAHLRGPLNPCFLADPDNLTFLVVSHIIPL